MLIIIEKINNFCNYYNFNTKTKKNKSKKSDKTLKNKSINELSSFDEILEANETDFEINKIKLNEEKLENLLKQIGNYGEKLKKSKLIKDLNIYKNLVKEYLSIVISLSEKTEKITMWNKVKKEKISKVHITIINQELLNLTKLFFAEQQNTFTIAAKIDKVEGLLIDLKS